MGKQPKVEKSKDIRNEQLPFIIIILTSAGIAFAITMAIVKGAVLLSAKITNISGIKIFVINGFFANLLPWILLFSTFFLLLVSLRFPFLLNKSIPPTKFPEKIGRILLIVVAVDLCSLIYMMRSYAIVTENSIHVSGFQSMFRNLEFGYGDVKEIRIESTTLSKGTPNLHFFLVLNDYEINLWSGGLYDREYFFDNIRPVYQKVKMLGKPIRTDIKYLNDYQQGKLEKIMKE